MADLKVGGQFKAPSRFEGKFELQRADLMLGGLIEGLEGRFEVWRSDLRLRGLIISLEG